jgi:hypothetical protein
VRRVRMQAGMRAIVKRIAVVVFAGYVAWNVVWLSRGFLPPSLLNYFTGLPCPTTGCGRSLCALWAGDLLTAVLSNPFTLLYIALICLSGAAILQRCLRGRELVLPPLLVRAWCFALCAGWAAKFVLGREYW